MAPLLIFVDVASFQGLGDPLELVTLGRTMAWAMHPSTRCVLNNVFSAPQNGPFELFYREDSIPSDVEIIKHTPQLLLVDRDTDLTHAIAELQKRDLALIIGIKRLEGLFDCLWIVIHQLFEAERDRFPHPGRVRGAFMALLVVVDPRNTDGVGHEFVVRNHAVFGIIEVRQNDRGSITCHTQTATNYVSEIILWLSRPLYANTYRLTTATPA